MSDPDTTTVAKSGTSLHHAHDHSEVPGPTIPRASFHRDDGGLIDGMGGVGSDALIQLLGETQYDRRIELRRVDIAAVKHGLLMRYLISGIRA